MAAPQLPAPAPFEPGATIIGGRALGTRGRSAPVRGRTLSPEQTAAIRAVMHIFVEDDLASGVSADQKLACDACRTEQQAPGFIQYDRHFVCNSCAGDYEIARAEGKVQSAADFVRGRAFTNIAGIPIMRVR